MAKLTPVNDASRYHGWDYLKLIQALFPRFGDEKYCQSM
jgi:hypothetical protein